MNRLTPSDGSKNPTREAAAETKAKSGRVRHIVTNGEPVSEIPDDLTWDSQVEEIRRLNAKVLGMVSNAIDDGNTTPEIRAALKDCSIIAKQHSANTSSLPLTPDEPIDLSKVPARELITKK